MIGGGLILSSGGGRLARCSCKEGRSQGRRVVCALAAHGTRMKKTGRNTCRLKQRHFAQGGLRNKNFGKRLVKSPKLYFVDSGLACHLLGIDSEGMLNRSPFLGPLFEGFVASEVIKQQIASGRSRALYYFRDQQGLEVDFIVPLRERKLLFLEAKASKTVFPEMGEPLDRLARASARYEVTKAIVHRGRGAPSSLRTLRPNIQALSLEEMLDVLRDRADR